MADRLSYAVVTPVRNEAENLARLAASLKAQTRRPAAWIVVDTGSTDHTLAIARGLERSLPLLTVVDAGGSARAERGAPVTRGFQRGLDALVDRPDVAVKLDADVSFDADYFALLLEQFERDPALGIASGTCYERHRGIWRQRHVTGTTVWGASRAYRWSCLCEVMPLEERMGWDGVDEFKANVRGWRTRTVLELPFQHHRTEGERDGAARARRAQGAAAYYIGYRFSYLALRALFHSRYDRAALSMVLGFALAQLRRAPRLEDPGARAFLRERQRLRALPARLREATGRR